MSSVKIDMVTEPLVLGEGPHWDERQQALFCVDISQKSIHKYVPTTGQHTSTKLDTDVTFIIPVEGASDQFVVGCGTKVVVLEWDGTDGATVRQVNELADISKYRDGPIKMNDGKADPRGRLYTGTLMVIEDLKDAKPLGSIYRLEGAKCTKLWDGITIANGLAWDLKQKAMYYIDSMEQNIRRYDYDVETGDISNLKYIFDFKENNLEGYPDGATIDTDGNLWVAAFNTSSVIKIDPRTGKLLQQVHVPAKQVTSVTFGGPNFDELFVTTGNIKFGSDEKPPGGNIFKITGLGVKGLPNKNFKL